MWCLQYAHEQGYPLTADVTEEETRHNRLACLRYAIEHNCAWGDNLRNLAQHNQCTECLEYLMVLGPSEEVKRNEARRMCCVC